MHIEPITLEGVRIRLVPLNLSHHASLCEVGLDERLWRATTIRVRTPEEMLAYIQTALQQQAEGTALPFAIVEKQSGKVIGTSRYHSINREHRRLEIGFTWIAVPWQGTGINTEAKYLMLKNAFERYKCVRVEFKADSRNEQSYRALTRIGAKQEGVLRSYAISGHKGERDLTVFSIIASEWPEVKAHLEERLNRRE